MRSGGTSGFLPSRHGFAFPNRWPAGPAFELRIRYLRIGIGEVAEGLCAGMCFAAADRFMRGEIPPPDTSPPSRGTPLFHEIARRQLDSLHWLMVAPIWFWWTAARLRVRRWTARDQVRQWLAIRGELDAGRPAMLGLVRSANLNPFSLSMNHAVLGFAYEAEPAEATVRIYDPNHPGRDDVVIRLRIGSGAGPPGRPASATSEVSLEQTTGEPLLAVLRLPYRPARSR